MTTAALQKPKGGRSVIEQRLSPLDALDDFPTPPWATRAFLKFILPRFTDRQVLSVWEPACGRGIMSEVLKERFPLVYASDIHDYGKGYNVGAFVSDNGLALDDVTKCPFKPDWIITNPPFKLALEFAARGVYEAPFVALLLRTAFVESFNRYRFYCDNPFYLMAPYAERVPMTQGGWNPKATTMTSYTWFVWTRPAQPGRDPRVKIIPFGCSKSLTHIDDAARFAARGDPA